MMEEKLAKMQQEVDELYVKEGLSDEVLEKQLEINALRNEHDIADKNELVYENFVQ